VLALADAADAVVAEPAQRAEHRLPLGVGDLRLQDDVDDHPCHADEGTGSCRAPRRPRGDPRLSPRRPRSRDLDTRTGISGRDPVISSGTKSVANLVDHVVASAQGIR
jgi:hypothetical protein